ncbi:MAG TPA: hypothetical protein VEK34_07220 [Methylocella sp.]|nr:hypothetical protein [Methylocella sp.]
MENVIDILSAMSSLVKYHIVADGHSYIEMMANVNNNYSKRRLGQASVGTALSAKFETARTTLDVKLWAIAKV